MGGRGVKQRKPYPYIHEITDCHGHPRIYLRKPGCPSVALPYPPGSRAFLEAYYAALEAEPEPIRGKAKPRTIAALVDLYCHSRKWTDLSPGSQRTYRYVLEPFVTEHGHRLVAQMEAKHVDAIMEARASTPVAANRLRKLLQSMMRIAIMQGWRKDNPCLAVDNFKIKSKGHRPWEDNEIETYRRHYAIGTEQRLAFELLLNTGQRVSDVVKMGRKHVKDGAITITQKKSGETVEVTIPILPALNVVLDEVQARRINHVRRVAQTSWPTRRSARAWTPQGVLPRGGRGRYDGHKTLGEVMRYTAAVDRKKLAASGMAKIKP